uniref:Arginine decarboxylase n=1 Tax=Wollemia nobilis TaxID=56998 RepID=A0A0C9RFY5_9CONI
MPPLACVEAVEAPHSHHSHSLSYPSHYSYGYGLGYALPGEGSLPVPAIVSNANPFFPNANSAAAWSTVHSSANSTAAWSTAHSSALYKVDGWGAPYFVVNENGNMAVRPHGSLTLPSEEIDIMKVIKKVVEPKSAGGLGMCAPLMIRFPDVLKHRLEALQSAFDSAIGMHMYESHFQGVYPVKCNQDRYIVENVVEFGKQYCFGLEAGSKPELLLAMACLCKGSPKALLVCNGYKDEEYVSLALLARRMDFNSVIVLEQEEELDVVIAASRKMSVRPVMGVRAKLRTKHAGHFGGTSGEKGKFGLTSVEIVSVVKKLRKEGMLDCLQLLHFHIGSQIPSVTVLNDGVSEAAHIYCELVKMGANMKVIDIGGGLGIDYDGTKSASSDMSVAYDLEEYASAVVEAVRAACTQKGVVHPVLCSESGRALVSHHSLLVFDVVSMQDKKASAAAALAAAASGAELDSLPAELVDEYKAVEAYARIGDCQMSRAAAQRMKMKGVDLFKEGMLSLEQLAMVDGVCEVTSGLDHAQAEEEEPPTVCHINLSIFKSMPDYWAIGQLFPVMPIHKLNERPTVRAILSDLTCDSDGKIETFVGEGGRVHSLAMHSWSGDPYYLGMFLGGAYQEALGGLHNLFGAPNVVHVVQSSGPHCFAITRALPGQTSADVLGMMMHEPHIMFDSLKCRMEDSLSLPLPSCLPEHEYDSTLNAIASAFQSLPYLSSSSNSSTPSSSDVDDEFEDDDDIWTH